MAGVLIETADNLIARVETDDGTVGWGEAASAPTMTGDPELERHIRVHANTLESLVMHLPALWLFAIYWNDMVAAVLGAIWIVGYGASGISPRYGVVWNKYGNPDQVKALRDRKKQGDGECELSDFRYHGLPPWPANFSFAIGCPACLRASAASGGM